MHPIRCDIVHVPRLRVSAARSLNQEGRVMDIVERLRQGVGHRQEDCIDAERCMDKAADEIERLQVLEAELYTVLCERNKQAAEIERPQELLRGVGANRYWEGRWRDERERCARLERLIQIMLDEDPNDLAADGGVTVLDVWRKKAAAAIRKDVSPSPASSPAPDCP